MLVRAFLLLLLTMLACWPTWSLPDWDGTEGRRVQIALEMLRNGDWLVPSLGAEPTWAKPPLHYWLLAACLQVFGDGQVGARLPSVLGVWLAAWLAGELLRARFGERAGWIGALGIVCAPLVPIVWPTAEIDPLFACFTAASLWCLGCGAGERRRGLVLASGVLAGLALLHKGPPFFLFAAGAYFVWWRERRLWGVVAHVLPMLAVALAYYVPLWTLRVAPGELLAVVNEESVGRVAFFEWRHVRAIPEYWLRALTMTLPFGLWWRYRTTAPAAAAPSVVAPSTGGSDAAANVVALRMCLWAVGVAMVALTFFPGRPTRYLLPNVLLLVFAMAPALAAFVASAAPLPRSARRVLVGLGIVGSIGLVVVPFVPRAGIGAIGLAAAVAVGAGLAHTRAQVVALALVLPLVASWTVGLDRANAWSDAPRARVAAGALLQRELGRIGVAATDLRTAGHLDSPLLLAADLLPPGDEFGRKPWRGRWVLHEDNDPALRVPADYAPRLRLDLPFKSFVLRERVEAGR